MYCLGRAALVRWRISTVLPASEQKRKDLPQINGRAGRALALSDPARPRGHSAPKPSGGQDEPLVFAGNQRTDVKLYRASCLTVQRDLSAMRFSFGTNSSDMWEGISGVRNASCKLSGRARGWLRAVRCPGRRRNLMGACRSQMESSGRQTPKSQLIQRDEAVHERAQWA